MSKKHPRFDYSKLLAHNRIQCYQFHHLLDHQGHHKLQKSPLALKPSYRPWRRWLEKRAGHTGCICRLTQHTLISSVRVPVHSALCAHEVLIELDKEPSRGSKSEHNHNPISGEVVGRAARWPFFPPATSTYSNITHCSFQTFPSIHPLL